MSASRTWLRSARFDVGLQLGALCGIAPAVVVHAAFPSTVASTLMPAAALIAIPFLHVFGSFFFAFSERNQSASPPRRLAVEWAIWTGLSIAIGLVAPRGLATFALLYGAWHILRQNFGFLRELAQRDGLAGDRALRRYDLAACLSPAIALWLYIAARGPWSFLGADIFHVAVPTWLCALAFAGVPATWLLRERALAGRGRSSRAAALLLGGNALALLGPALVLDDLLLIYALSASYHGLQYLAYLAAREREARPADHPEHVLLPLVSMVVVSMIGWFAAIAFFGLILPRAGAERALIVAWYAIVPFHYFVDGKIWRRPRRPAARRAAQPAAFAEVSPETS